MRAERKIFAAALVTVGLFTAGIVGGASSGKTSSPEGTSRLVSVQELPNNPNDVCSSDGSQSAVPAPDLSSTAEQILFSALQQDPFSVLTDVAQRRRESSSPRAKEEREAAEAGAPGALSPVRTIRDTAPTYTSVAVDANSNEVILQDDNLWEYQVFDRLSPTLAGPNDITPAKRTVRGDKTLLQFNVGLYVDPHGDVFSVEADTGNRMVRFSRDANGDATPKALLHTPHRAYNLAGDEARQELFLTVEYPPEVVVYRKDASGDEKPLRTIQGNDTGLDSPHGIALDDKDGLMFVNTWGDHSDAMVAGTGKWFPPAIKVYPLEANGDVKPLRVITGGKTQMDFPSAMQFNPENGDLYVANDMGQSVLVFANAPGAHGDVAPAREIHGPRTRLRYPTGVALDLNHKEVWVSNLGNSSATVYPLMANGDTAPLRVIRSAEESKRGLDFGRTSAVAYDPIRQEILVPN
jgi:hypothetical protein